MESNAFKESVQQIFENLKYSKKEALLKILNANQINLNDSEKVFETIYGLAKGLKIVNLSKKEITDEELIVITNYLVEHCPDLKNLSLQENNFEKIKSVELLEKLTSLESLNIARNSYVNKKPDPIDSYEDPCLDNYVGLFIKLEKLKFVGITSYDISIEEKIIERIDRKLNINVTW